MEIRIIPALPQSKHGQATDSPDETRISPGLAPDNPRNTQMSPGLLPGFKMTRISPDVTQATHGRHTDYPDELRITPRCCHIKPGLQFFPDHPGCLKYFKTSLGPTSQGSPRTAKDQPRMSHVFATDQPGQRRIHNPGGLGPDPGRSDCMACHWCNNSKNRFYNRKTGFTRNKLYFQFCETGFTV